MAIAFGAISTVSTSQTPTSVAVSGSNTLGIVYVVGDTAADNITAATWDGSAMTKIAAVQTPTGDRYSSAWWIANPASSAAIAFTGGSFWRSYSFYYTGAAQTGQPDSFNTGTNSANTAISVATTVVASDCWYVMCLKDGVGGETYTGSGVLVEERANADAGGIAIADSGTTVSTGSQSGTMTSATSTTHGAIAFSIAPVATSAIKTINGLAVASVKTVNGLAIASVKTVNGLQ